LAAQVPSSDVTYTDGLETIISGVYNNLPHPLIGQNVAGYISWGAHSSLGANYHANISWTGASGWWVIQTVESFNGQRIDPGQGNFIKWFSATAFGGLGYANTPVGAVTHVEEPNLGGVSNAQMYFGLWAQGKSFGCAAWHSRSTAFFQAVGDPFVKW
jgi:hypothetical protein